MTDAQIKVLEELGFKKNDSGFYKNYGNYVRTFIANNGRLSQFNPKNVDCQSAQSDLARLREEGIV